jgi:hypothetical protein
MTSFARIPPAALAFVAGMALLSAAVLAFRLRRAQAVWPWQLFGAFAVGHGLAEWCRVVAIDEAGGFPLFIVGLALFAASWLALIEFGRRAVRRNGEQLLKPWTYAPLLAIAAILSYNGSAGLEAACRYPLALAGGSLAAVALVQMAHRNAPMRPWLQLMAAASAFCAMGYALAIPALQAFAALGLLVGVWGASREAFPLPAGVGAVQRWRVPAAFLVVVLAGTAALIERGQPQEQGSLAAAKVYAVSGAGETGAAGYALDSVEIDPRQLARERVSQQRLKQGASILVVIVIVAGVWVGFSRMQGVK